MTVSWNDINKDYEAKYECDGKVVIVRPKLFKLVVPLFCPTCGFLMSNSDDSIAYREGECCYKCDLHWRRPHIENWNKGWRPSKEDMRAYITERKSLAHPTIKFK